MAWIRGKKVSALWVNYQKANSWAYIDGAWRKYEDDHDDATTNFTILGAAAKGANRNVDVRVESGAVKEMYVW